MTEVTARSLRRSSAYAFIAQIWRIGSRFVLTPLIIGQIGLEGYGVWTLLFTICGYVGVVDANFGVAYSKFTAEYDAKRDYPGLAGILGSGMMLVGSFAAVALTALWLYRAPILRTLGVPQGLSTQAGQALFLVSLCVLMRMSLGCVFQVLVGLQRMDLRHKLAILASAIEFVVSIALLYRGWGLLALATGHFCGQVLGTALAWWLCRRLCPQLRISPLYARLSGLRHIVSLGGRFQLLSGLQFVIQQGTKLVISGLLGVSMLGIFELAHKLVSLGSAVGGAVIAPLMPAFANLYACEERERFRLLYERGSKAVSVVCMSCFVFLAIFADRLIVLWTAHEYPLAAWTARWLALAFFASQLTGVGTASLRGRGTIRLEVVYGLIAGMLLAALLGPGYWLWGYEGIVGAFVTSVIVASGWFIVSCVRRDSLDLLRYLRETLLRPMAVLGPVIVITGVLGPVLQLPLLFTSRRLSTLADVALWGVLFGTAVAVCGWFGLLSQSERASVVRYFAGLRGLRLVGRSGPLRQVGTNARRP